MRSMGVLLITLGLVGCGGSSSTSSTPPHSSTAPASTSSTATKTVTATATATTSSSTSLASVASGATCQTSKLHLSFLSGQGAAGTAFLNFALVNVGSQPCTMSGYPGVAFLDSSGQIVQHPAERGVPVPTPVQRITLRAGQRARFIVTSSDVIPSPGCQHSYAATTVQVYPPNQRAALTLARPMMFCNLHVGPVQRSG